MNFISILFTNASDQQKAQEADTPSFFADLNLDQIINAVTTEWEEYDLKPFFYFKPSHIDTVYYRQEVFRDVGNESLYERIERFAEGMREVRMLLALRQDMRNDRQQQIWFLYAVEKYGKVVKDFANDLASGFPQSKGFAAFHEYLADYTGSNEFTVLTEETNRIKSDLSKANYQMIIGDDFFTVQDYNGGTDYGEQIEVLFSKFKQEAATDDQKEYNSSAESMNRIEAKILEFIARLNPDIFSELQAFCIRHEDFIDEKMSTFDREIHFYIAWLEQLSKFKPQLQFCYPGITNTSKEIYSHDGFDLALAQKLVAEDKPIVCNDFYLKNSERVIVVTGPNQGGKTTFARTFGQLHYLAGIGCSVPGSQAQLFFYNRMFTQFERTEKVRNKRGKLENDLTRIHALLKDATPESAIIMNEIFSSTTFQDMKFLSTKIMENILDLDCLCVWVTFVDELASFSEQTVSMTSMVDPENPALRTYKILRRPADGLAYALAIAKKYGLIYNKIKKRIDS